MFSHRFSFRLFVMTWVLAAFICASSVQAAGPKDVLKLVPEDAWLFAVGKAMSGVDEKAAMLKEMLGLQYPTPVTPMALGMLGLTEKVEMDRPVCIVLMDAQKFGGGMNPGDAAVLLLPAKEPKALVAGLTPPEPEPAEGEPAKYKPKKESKLPEGITKITVMGRPAYAASAGNYVILGPNLDCVTKVAQSKKSMVESVDEARMASLEKADVYISISLSTIFGAYKDMFMPMMQMMTAATDPEGKSLKQITKICSEMRSLDIAARLDKGGMSFSLLMTPTKDSDFEKLLRDTKNADRSYLTLLPREKYLFAFAGAGGYSEHSAKFSDQNVFSQIIQSLDIEGVNEDAIKAMDAEVLKMAKDAGPMAGSISYLPDGKEGLFAATVVTQPRDPKEYLTGFRKMYDALWTVLDKAEKPKIEAKEGKPAKSESEESEGDIEEDELAEVREQMEKLKKCVVHKVDAETIEGAKVDTLTIKLDEQLADAMELDMEDFEDVQKVVGKEIVVRFGAVDGKHFVIAYGGGPKRFEAIIRNLKSGKGGLEQDAGIKAMAGQLPSPRAAELYVAADNIMQAVKSAAKALGREQEVPFDLPVIDAPLAGSTVQRGSTTQVELVVPTKLITTIKETVDKQMSSMTADFDEDDEDAIEEGDESEAEGGKTPAHQEKKEEDDEGDEEDF